MNIPALFWQHAIAANAMDIVSVLWITLSRSDFVHY